MKLATNQRYTDHWRDHLAVKTAPCAHCGQLVLPTSCRGCSWDLSAHDAGIVAELRGLDPKDPTLGAGISRPHVCPLPLFPNHEPKR